jgi:DNA-binding FadR family transcriptional regulator
LTVQRGGRAGSAVDETVARIRALIAERGLGIGDSLPTERELCERFATSRNTVREAMRILKAWGVVDVRPKVGATIIDQRMTQAFEQFSFNLIELSRQGFADIQGFRILLEVGSVETLFQRATPEDIADLRRINGELLGLGDLDQAIDADFRFHTRLIAVLDNRAIVDVYRIMRPAILRIMRRGKTRHTFETETFREHDEVISALEARDRLAYQYRMKAHLEGGYRYFGDNP